MKINIKKILGIVALLALAAALALPLYFDFARRREVLAMWDAQDNFAYVDHVVKISGGQTLLDIRAGDEGFEDEKARLNPFYGHVSGEPARVVRQLRRMADHSAVIRYFIENELLFTTSVFLFYEHPVVTQCCHVLLISPPDDRIFVLQGDGGAGYGVGLINNGVFIARFR